MSSINFKDPYYKLHCPICGTLTGLQVSYGYPTDEAWGLASAGKIAIGGCDIDIVNDPNYICSTCDYSWRTVNRGQVMPPYEDDEDLGQVETA